MKITKHAYRRAKQRLGLGRKAFTNLAYKARKEGVTDFKGRLVHRRNEILSKYPNCTVVMYGEVLYIFKGDFLITLYHLPYELRIFAALSRGESAEKIRPYKTADSGTGS